MNKMPLFFSNKMDALQFKALMKKQGKNVRITKVVRPTTKRYRGSGKYRYRVD